MTGLMTTTAPGTATKVRSFRAPEGCQAHRVIDRLSRQAMVIDPRLDQVDEILDAARTEDVHVPYLLDTHTHADRLSGMRLLSERTGAGIPACSTTTSACAAATTPAGHNHA